ncbi:MAG: hypothetical protein IJ354_06755 [Clostridia bacterium]|nr:hypothetical protein [Clostridia bacterium]
MKKRLLVMLLCAAACLTSCTQDMSLAYSKAVDLFASGNYADAAKAFERLDDYANSPTYAAYSRGLVLYEQGQYAAAEPYFEKTQTFMYGADRYRYCRAHGLMDAGQFADASIQFSSLGDFEDATLWRSYCSARDAEDRKDYESALYGYEEAGLLADAEDRLYNLRGQIYNRAIELKAQGNYGDAGVLFTMLGDYLSSAEQAVECKAFHLDSQYALAEEYENTGDLQNAYDLFNGLSGYRDAADRAEALAPQLGIELENRDKYFN